MWSYSTSVRAMVGLFVATATLSAQEARGLDEMEGDLAAGKELKFSIRYNSAGGVDAPRSSRIYGNSPIYMADGAVTLSRDKIAFNATVGRGSFSVQPDKIVGVTSEPSNGSRVHLEALLVNARNGKEERKHFYLYNRSATGAGDGAVGGPGASIVCSGCDDSMEKMYALIMRIRDGGLRATQSVASPSASSVTNAMTNEDVLQMVQGGLSATVISNAIQQAKDRRFDLSPTSLIALKKANVPDTVVLSMQTGSAPKTETKPEPERTGQQASQPAPPPPPRTPQPGGCTGIENMGLYKNEIFDRAMGGGVVEWLAKIRNNTPVTHIVAFGWRDQNGQERQGRVQIAGGAIASPRLDLTQAKFIAPLVNLRLLSCE